MTKIFQKNCTACGEVQQYSTKNRLNCSIRENWICNKCSSEKKKKIYSDEVVEEIIKLYTEGVSFSKLARIVRIKRDNVKKILIDKKIWVENRDQIKIDFSDSDVDKIVRYYCDEKLSCQKISSMFNCSKKPISDLLKKLGLLREGKSDGKKIHLSDEQKTIIEKLYLEGKKELSEISKIVGITESFLDKYLTTCEYRRTRGKAISIRQTGKKRSKEYVEKLSKIQKVLRASGKIKQSGGVCKEYNINGLICTGTFEKYYIEFLINNGQKCPENAKPINTPYGVYYPDFSYEDSLIEIKSDYTYEVLIGNKPSRWTNKFDTTQYKKIKWVDENVTPVKILVVDKKNNQLIEKL